MDSADLWGVVVPTWPGAIGTVGGDHAVATIAHHLAEALICYRE